MTCVRNLKRRIGIPFLFFYTWVMCILLGYYLFARWYMSDLWNRHRFFLLVETIILVHGLINLNVIVFGSVFYSMRDKPQYVSSEEIISVFSPTIHIFIPVCKEPLPLLFTTFDAIKNIDTKYDIRVYIGDDGWSDELQESVEESYPSFQYIRRSYIYGHAKAGNINNILTHIKKTKTGIGHHYVLILDSDMVAVPYIVDHLVQCFYTKKDGQVIRMNRAFIQSRQKFNTYVGMYDVMGQCYDYFYDIVMTAWQGYNKGVPCCGTNVMFCYDILQDVGGFQYGSITEDFNTSLKIHAMGYESYYYHEKTLAIGMSPFTLDAFYIQRYRWSMGGLQILWRKHFLRDIYNACWILKYVYVSSAMSPVVYIFILLLIISPIINILYYERNVSLPLIVYEQTFGIYVCMYMLIIVGVCFRKISLMAFIASFQETIFMTPLHVVTVLRFFATCSRGNFPILLSSIQFVPTNKNFTFNAAYFYGIRWLLPFIVYVFLAGSCINKYSVVGSQMDMGWIVIALLQMYPPFVHFLFCRAWAYIPYDYKSLSEPKKHVVIPFESAYAHP